MYIYTHKKTSPFKIKLEEQGLLIFLWQHIFTQFATAAPAETGKNILAAWAEGNSEQWGRNSSQNCGVECGLAATRLRTTGTAQVQVSLWQRLLPPCRRSQGRDTARAARRRPGPEAAAGGPRPSGDKAEAEAAGGARRRGGGETPPLPRAEPPRRRHCQHCGNGRGEPGLPLRRPPRSSAGRAGPGSPTCVSDDDVLEEVRVGHGRSRAAAPGLSRFRSGVTRALAARARAAERRKRVNGPRAAPPPARSLLPPPPPAEGLRSLGPAVRPPSVPPRPRRRRQRQKAAAAARTINRRRAAPGPSGDVSARPLTPPRPRPGNAGARGRLSPPAGGASAVSGRFGP